MVLVEEAEEEVVVLAHIMLLEEVGGEVAFQEVGGEVAFQDGLRQ